MFEDELTMAYPTCPFCKGHVNERITRLVNVTRVDYVCDKCGEFESRYYW